MINPNTIIGNRYRVSRLLGGGGMKMVYLAEDLRLAARPCALAEMVDAISSAEMQRQAAAAFQREADMLAELNHEHIPRIFDRFSEQNHHYLVMEYVDGVTLEQQLKTAGGKPGEARVIDIALQVLDTLAYLHHREPPVIYRDLKPSNIMITKSGLVKLIDFGIARHFQPLSSATMVGTQGYAPPEQYRGKVEVRSDLYALGATMHHALSGRDPALEPPFSFPPLRKLCPQLNAALADLVGEALIYDVDRRIANVDEFQRRLIAIKTDLLTGGVGPASTASPAAVAHGKPQLQLPLKSPPPASSPSAPTLLTTGGDITCPMCTRPIPGDSRFCSYCAADLRRTLGPDHVIGDPEGQTITLDQPWQSQSYEAPRPTWRQNAIRRRARRSPLMTLLILAALAFVAVRLILLLSAVISANGAGESSPPPATYVNPEERESGDSSPEDAIRSTRLRQILNATGYTSVHFRLRGQNITLWGKVPNETDRLMVESTAFAVTGAIALDDHIEVEE